jgi:hypothetical protein
MNNTIREFFCSRDSCRIADVTIGVLNNIATRPPRKMEFMGTAEVLGFNVHNYKCPVCGDERFFVANGGIFQELSERQKDMYLKARNINLFLGGMKSEEIKTATREITKSMLTIYIVFFAISTVLLLFALFLN